MALKLTETRVDHSGKALPAGVYGLARPDGTIASYKVRWREEGDDGVRRNAGKSFSVKRHGSANQALEKARTYREEALRIVDGGAAVLRPDAAAAMTIEELFREWCVKRGPNVSKRYAEDAVRRWDREVATRSISRVRLDRLSSDPSLITRFQDELESGGMTSANRAQVLKLLRAVLRWGRRRHPNALTIELSGLFEVPSRPATRLAFAADAYGLERIIEAALKRPARNPLLPLRDAALIAAMGFTVAARPSEWLHSARWLDLHEHSVELQRPNAELDEESPIGLKTGARAALLLPNARQRLLAYRESLEALHGAQPGGALVFQALGEEGPLWWLREDGEEPVPVPWTFDDYKRWTARIWRPAREQAARADDAPEGLASMRFYDCRHTAISMALHSSLVMGQHGMNLHNLAGWAGHDVQTLQRYYAHIIARHQGAEPIDLERECAQAQAKVEAEPFRPSGPAVSPQRAAQRRRRARKRASRSVPLPP